MKRLVFAAALSFAASAFADTVQSASTFGVLKIADTTHTNLAVCVPWVAAGAGGPIKVADIVMASNREEGDVVYYYSGSAFLAWGYSGGEWSALSSVTTNGVAVGAAVANQTANRGGSLIIHRNTSESLAKPIYLYGQYSNESATTAITAGSSESPVISLIAPPSTAADGYDMNAQGHATVSDGSVGTDDYIQLSGDTKRYQFNSNTGKWGVYGKVVWTSGSPESSFTEGLTIPAGQGALYVSKGGNPTFTW